MKEPRLWISNRNGNVFTVSGSERYIIQLMKTNAKGVRVKRLAASDWCAWAIGHDHRVYIYVIASELPIRVPETTYENQRWSPISGFRSSNLLPTDRNAWSNEHGEGDLPKESIRLPSSHWEWEGEWFIDENLQGDICTDSGGWQYAVNFNGRWASESCWNSCVRKRKWIRFCRFTATNTWARVSDMEVVERRECFIDLSVGGQMLPNQLQDFLSVWAISNSGQVHVRTGVCRDCPEGKDWKHIPCPDNMGIINISCGPTGLVWAVTWDGHAIVRTHVSRESVYGLGWEVVPYPEESTRLKQVAVGRNSVWALSRDGKVWFRQGVNGDKLFWDATAATGNAWVLMVGEMEHVAVSANDQVFGLGRDDEDKEIWFRTGISPSEPGGRTWQRVVLEENPDVFDPNSPGCLLSIASQPSLDSPEDPFTMSDCFNSTSLAAAFPREFTQGFVNDMMDGDSPLPVMSLLTSARTNSFDSSSASFPERESFCEGSSAASRPKLLDRSKSWQVVEIALQSGVKTDRADVAVEATESRHGLVPNLQDGKRRSSDPVIPFPASSSSAGPKVSVRGADWVHHSEGSVTTGDGSGSVHRTNPVAGTIRAGETDTQSPRLRCSGKGDGGGDKIAADFDKENTPVDTVVVSKHDHYGTESDNLNRVGIRTTHTSQVDGAQAAGQSAVEEIFAAHSPSNIMPHLHCDVLKLSSCVDDGDLSRLSSSFPSNIFDSLDSVQSSDIICNFATDLISSEEDSEEGDRKTEDKLRGESHDDQQADWGQVTFQEMHDQGEDASGPKSDKQAVSIPWISMGPSENFTGLSSPPTVERESIPAMTLTLAQPRYAWGWLAAGAFVVENMSCVPWLFVSSYTGCDPSVQFLVSRVSRDVRDDILQQLKARNKRHLRAFSSYEHAIEKTTWVKKANVKIRCEGKDYDCVLELEQGLGKELDGTLTLQFKLKRKSKVIQLSLQEIRCLKVCDDHCIALYTSDPQTSVHPLTLIMGTEVELCEWLGTVNSANLSLWRLNTPVAAGSVCSLTVPGHVFFHAPDDAGASPLEMMWGQHGGHMAAIETTPCGIIWAISFDQTPWVYNGGYGNAFTRELSEMASNLREQVDYRTIRVYENQKWYPVVGYCSRGVFNNNFAWTTPKGKFVKSREDIKLPSSHWQWVSDWMVDFTTAGGVNNEGWQYSSKFYKPYHAKQGLRDSVRRRQWSRKCKLVTHGPWISVGPPELMDISLQVDAPSSPAEPIVLWAIGANGDVLCRSGVTVTQPMGKNWIHVATKSDMPFKSVSVGGRCRVWGIAVDGSVWYRPGVTPFSPDGTCWIQVIPPPPGGALLSSVSAGETAVWAVDTGGNLWRREEITPTFPEGTRWTFVCNHVRRVSVGAKDQVWIVSEANFGRNKHSAGALYRRLGITEATPSGTDWELVIGPGWHYVSIRALRTPNK